MADAGPAAAGEVAALLARRVVKHLDAGLLVRAGRSSGGRGGAGVEVAALLACQLLKHLDVGLLERRRIESPQINANEHLNSVTQILNPSLPLETLNRTLPPPSRAPSCTPASTSHVSRRFC